MPHSGVISVYGNLVAVSEQAGNVTLRKQCFAEPNRVSYAQGNRSARLSCQGIPNVDGLLQAVRRPASEEPSLLGWHL